MNSPFESSQTSREKLLTLLVLKAYRYGTFTLSSGRKSNHYVNCKPVSLSGVGLVLLRFVVMSVMFSGYVSDGFWIWSGLDDVKTLDAM